MIGGEQAHDDPRRAETALRGVVIDHCPLQRMQFAALGKVLDRDEFRSVELAQEQNAGVERLVGERPGLEPRQNDGASAAIPLGAALLRPLRSHFLAQPIENGRTRERSGRAQPRRPGKGTARHCERGSVLSQATSSLLDLYRHDGAFVGETEVSRRLNTTEYRLERDRRQSRVRWPLTGCRNPTGGLGAARSIGARSSPKVRRHGLHHQRFERFLDAHCRLRIRAEAAQRDRVFARLLAAESDENRNLRQ